MALVRTHILGAGHSFMAFAASRSLPIFCFSDVLCVFAYAANARLEQLRAIKLLEDDSVIEASVHELLRKPVDEMSWC